MIDTPWITATAAQPTACIHVTVPRTAIATVMGPAIGELFAAIAAQGLTPAGPWFTHHLRLDPAVFDVAISVPVAGAVVPNGRVRGGLLAARPRVARTVYHGPYDGLGAAWGAFSAWLTANGHTADSDLWECYVAGPESGGDPTQWRTELNRPLIGG